MRLFLSLFCVILAGLTAVTAGAVAVGVHFFHFDSAAWTHWTWTSRPSLVLMGLTGFSLVVSLGLSLCWALFSGVISRMVSAGSRKPRPARRSQSYRRTTV